MAFAIQKGTGLRMLNKVILMGRLCADPDFRQTPSGVALCRFRIAVDRGFTPKDGGERQADFITVVAWRSNAEFVSRYFTKGKMIIVEGALRNADYTDNNGVKHYAMEVQADRCAFGESKSASQANSGGSYAQASPAPAQPSFADTPPRTSLPPELGKAEDFEEIVSDGDVPF